MINVVNIKTHVKKAGETDIYIGRGSVLGNPFSHKTGTLAEVVCASREEAIEKYKSYFEEQIKDADGKFINELRRIYVLSRQTDVNLMCFCYPLACHGNIIKDFLSKF
jgi:hypothetical protein